MSSACLQMSLKRLTQQLIQAQADERYARYATSREEIQIGILRKQQEKKLEEMQRTTQHIVTSLKQTRQERDRLRVEVTAAQAELDGINKSIMAASQRQSKELTDIKVAHQRALREAGEFDMSDVNGQLARGGLTPQAKFQLFDQIVQTGTHEEQLEMLAELLGHLVFSSEASVLAQALHSHLPGEVCDEFDRLIDRARRLADEDMHGEWIAVMGADGGVVNFPHPNLLCIEHFLGTTKITVQNDSTALV
jgi:hypothetical protein